MMDETEDECTILYDLFVLADWPQEPEVLVSQTSRGPDVHVKDDGEQDKPKSMWSWVRGQALRSLPSIASIPQALLKVINSRLAWQLAIDNSGQMLAVLQETSIEIHVERDNFATAKGRSLVPKDANPQFRKLAWSADSTFVAVSTSYGNIMGFDLLGNKKFTIETVAVPETGFVDLSQALCALVFLDCKDDTQWSTELLAINYQGKLLSYLISITGDYSYNYSYSFISGCPQGVATATFDNKHSILILGSSNVLETDNRKVSQAQAHGITAWRKLSGHPHFKALTDFTTQISTARRMSLGMKNAMRTSGLLGGQQKQDGVCKLRLSANESVLAALHWSGALSLWQLPSLRRKIYWPVEEQSENITRRDSTFVKEPTHQGLADINFWSQSALILAWCNGNVTISSAISLNNLIGESHEWMHPMPQVLPAFNEGFIALECEAVSGTKRPRDDSLSGRMEFVAEEDEEDDGDEDENTGYLQRSINLSKRMMYFVTESERFQPPRKKPKLVTRTYRLLQLKKTTPAEFFARKIENEEYGEALILGERYNLDTDQVYKHQWRKNRVSKATIYDYLNKIQKQSWVLKECLTRVPEDLEAAEELLQYGLRRTQLQTLLNNDSKEYQSLQENVDENDLENGSDSVEETLKKKQESLLEKINFSKLTFEQLEVCRCRSKLLMYLDRLKTYEAILGGGETALGKYDKDVFAEFRTKNIVQAALDYAQNSEYDALHVLFTYHGSDLLPHRLLIIGNIPETTPPHDYESLFPVICGENRAVEWEEYTHREDDWSESSRCQSILNPSPIDYGAFLYEENADMKRFRCIRPSHDLLRDWYLMRSREMEEYSSQVDNALDLLNIAMSGQIKGLENVYDDLQTLSMLVYECQTDPGLSLTRLQDMSDLEKIKLIMSKSTLEMFVKNYRKWVLGFLDQCETRQQGRRNQLTKEYLVDMSKEDLTFCKLIFENSKTGVTNPIISESAFLTETILSVLYACERTDQLNIAIQVAHCIPTKPRKTKGSAVDKLDKHLEAQELLQRHQIDKTLNFLKESELDEEEAKLIMIRLTRQAAKRRVLPDQKEWHQLLEDLLNLQRNVYGCMSQETCYEIYVHGLLGSNHLPIIRLASEVLSTAREGPDSRGRIDYESSSKLIVEAAKEYFNSSANLMDPSMDLARSCLQLMKDIPDIIQQELDLVAALALLDDFKVPILPLQVRLCEDNLDLVAEALKSSPNAYKDLRKLTKLAKLLRVCGTNEMERKGKVLNLIAKTAMKVNDYKLAYQVCSELVADNYSAIWPVCRQLGEASDFRELEARSGLLAFAVSHCDPDNLLDILLSKTQLETQILYERLGNLAEDHGSENEDVDMEPQNGVASGGLAKSLLSSVSGMSWGSVKGWIRPLMHQQSSISSGSGDVDGNQTMEQQGCHPFYEDVIPGALLDKTSMQYDRFVTSSGDAYPKFLQQSMLRASLMSDGQTPTLPDSQVLLLLCSEWLPMDATLALSYLLSLPKASGAEQCLRNLPHSVLSLQLGAYFYALQIYNHQNPCQHASLDQVFAKAPSDLIQEVSEGSRLQGEEVDKMYEQFDWFLKLLADVVQAEMLRGLGKGVDVARFSSDDEYKHETILGLVMTLEEEVYDIALSLAHRYQVSLWELHCTYLEFLFTDSGLTTDKLEEKIKTKEILGPLLSKPDDFHSRLISCVYPTLDGRDHSRLLYYFGLLSSCGIEGAVNPDTQLKLLKKLRAAASSLDYKALTDGETDPMEVIQPTLNSSNVHVFAKNASKIPKPGGGFLDPETVFAAHILKLFWEGDQGVKEAPQNMADWLKRFEVSKEYFNRVSTKEVGRIIRNIVFSRQSLEKLDVECRENIIRRGVKCIQQQGGKKKGQVATGSEEHQQLMKQYLKHINSLQDSAIQMLVTSDKDLEVEYALQYDLSAGEVEKLAILLRNMVLNRLDVRIINQIIKLADWKKPTKVLYQESLQYLLNSIRCSSPTECTEEKDNYSTKLKNVLDAVTTHEENGGELLKVDDLLPRLRDFSREADLQQTKRLLVIDATEQCVDLSLEDMELFLLYRTQSIVSQIWDVNVTLEDVHSPEKQRHLFLSLLKKCSNFSHLQSLSNLLYQWPPNEGQQKQEDLWLSLLSNMIEHAQESHDIQELINTFRKLQSVHPSQLKFVEKIYQELADRQQNLACLKVALLTCHKVVHQKAFEFMSSIEEITDDCYDNELLELLVTCGEVALFVNTKYYPLLVEHVTENNREAIPSLTKQLYQAGYKGEAGTLYMSYKGSHSMLWTLNTAMASVSNFMKKFSDV